MSSRRHPPDAEPALLALDRLKLAVQFLTRLPVRLEAPPGPADLSGAVEFFPVVGALVGALGALVYAFALLALGLPSLPASILTLAALVLVTGGLHEDGLADTADGLGGGRTKEAKLAIMRDSRVGSFGVLALVLAVVARLDGIAGLWDPAHVAATLIASGAASRAAMPAVMALSPPARDGGLGAAAGRPELGRAAAGLGLAAVLAFALLPPAAALAALLAAAAAAGVAAAVVHAQLGGHTGDTLGAVQQAAEIAFLFAVLAAERG